MYLKRRNKQSGLDHWVGSHGNVRFNNDYFQFEFLLSTNMTNKHVLSLDRTAAKDMIKRLRNPLDMGIGVAIGYRFFRANAISNRIYDIRITNVSVVPRPNDATCIGFWDAQSNDRFNILIENPHFLKHITQKLESFIAFGVDYDYVIEQELAQMI